MSSPSSYVRDRKSENERQLLDRRNGRPCPGHPAKHPSDGTVTKTSAALNVRNWAATHRSHFRAQPHASACQGRLSSARAALPVQVHAPCPMPIGIRRAYSLGRRLSPPTRFILLIICHPGHLPSWPFAFLPSLPIARLRICSLAVLPICALALLPSWAIAILPI